MDDMNNVQTNCQADQPPVNTQIPVIKPKSNLLPVLATLLLSAVIFGLGGYYLGIQSQSSKQNVKTQEISTPTPSTNADSNSPSPSLQPSTQEADLSDPLIVARKYLDAYIGKNWAVAKSLCHDTKFNENIADSYGFVQYKITGSEPDNGPEYFHVYVEFIDSSGNTHFKSPHSILPLEVLMFKTSSGDWKALTWYFFE